MTTFILMQIKLSICFWIEALTTAVYLWNQLSIRVSLTETIFLVTVYSESKFDQYSHLKFFSCLCYVIVFKDKQKSFIFQTRMCIFLSYIWNSTFIYKIMNTAICHIFMTFSIWWNEQQFSDLTDQASANLSANFSVNLSVLQTLIDQLDMSHYRQFSAVFRTLLIMRLNCQHDWSWIKYECVFHEKNHSVIIHASWEFIHN